MFLCSREQFIARWHFVLSFAENSFLFSTSRRKSVIFLYIALALFLPNSKAHLTAYVSSDELRKAGIVCLLSKLLWKLALVWRTEGIVREINGNYLRSHYFLLGNWVVRGKLG